MNRKSVLIILSVIIFLLAMYAFSPLLYDRKVNESVRDIGTSVNQNIEKRSVDEQTMPKTTAISVTSLGQGEFMGIAGHNAKGTAKMLKSGDKYFVRLEDNFEVTNGPDLYVYLGKNNKYDSNTEISRLKGNVGGQNYEIPQNIESSQYNEVWIWCKAFSVEFAKAELK